jgi:PASTA domain
VPSFTLTAAGQKVNLDAAGTAQAPFTVTNTSVETLSGRLLTRPSDPAKDEWFSIVGESVRDFGPNAAEQVVVQLNVPPTTAPGSYSFRLDAVSEVDPDEDFTEGPSVAFDVAAPPPTKKRKFPWWILAIVGAVVLLIIVGVVIWLVTRGGGSSQPTTPVPDVTTLHQPDAQSVLARAGFKSKVVTFQTAFPQFIGIVRSQDPAGQTPEPAGTVVTLRVGRPLIGTLRPPPPIRIPPPIP